MGGFDSFQPILPALPPLPPLEVRIVEVLPASDIWPHPQAPVPNLHKRGLTEARRVYDYHYGRTTDERLDAAKHLGHIYCLKARKRGVFWQPFPHLRFVDAKSSRDDWENHARWSPAMQRATNLGYFLTVLPEFLEKYGPSHVTKRELLELIRLKDSDLLHVCNALVCDTANESVKSARHEIGTTRLWEHRGQEFYFDDRAETSIQPTHSFTLNEPEGPDYASGIELLVKDKRFRDELPKNVSRTLELVFRRLDAGTEAKDVIHIVARDLNRDPHTVRRHLADAHRIASNLASDSSKLMALLESVVMPENRKIALASPFRPQLRGLAGDKPE